MNAPVPCKLTSRRRPPAALFNFPERRRNQPLRKFVPDLCQTIADLGVLAGLVRRKNSKLRGINSGRGTDSVPGHQFQSLTTTQNLNSVPFCSKNKSARRSVSQDFGTRRTFSDGFKVIGTREMGEACELQFTFDAQRPARRSLVMFQRTSKILKLRLSRWSACWLAVAGNSIRSTQTA
jgi:hypothetical protein